MNTKTKTSINGLYCGSVSLVMSLLAVVPSSGPFTGMLYITLITFPLAMLAYFTGAWRTATGALYFSLCCFIVSPMTWGPDLRIDTVIVGLMVVGVALNSMMYWNYVKKMQT